MDAEPASSVPDVGNGIMSEDDLPFKVVHLPGPTAVSAANFAESQTGSLPESEMVVESTSAKASAEPPDGRLLALNALRDLGVRHPQDVAGLSLQELREMLGDASSGLNDEDIAFVISWSNTELNKRPGRILRNVFASPGNVVLPATKYRKLAAASLPTAEQDAKVLTKQDLRRQKAAMDLLACFGQQDVSHLMEEAGTSSFYEWKEARKLALAMTHSAGSLESARRAWTKLCDWQLQVRGHWDLGSFSAIHLQQYLQMLSAKGPTVAAGALASLKFIETHLVLPLHTDDALVVPFDSRHSKHIAQQRDVLSVKMWKHLFTLARSREDVRWPAMSILRYVFSNLRFEHTSRATLSSDFSTPRDQVWEITEGKDGQPFRCAVPNFADSNWDMNLVLHREMEARFGPQAAARTMLFEMNLTPSGAVNVVDSKASYVRWTALLRAIMQLQPLALDDAQAAKMSSYSARRLFPTVADGLGLSPHERNGLGNWRDGSKEPMHVRYSAFRLSASGDTKRVCIRSLSHLSNHAADSEVSRIAVMRPHLQRVRDHIMKSSWGTGAETLPPVEEPAPQDVVLSPSGTSTSDSPSSDSSDSDLDDAPSSFAWLIFPSGTVVHASSPVNSLKALCPMKVAPESSRVGNGAWDAMHTGLPLCPRCAGELPKAVVKSFLS